MDDLIRRQDAIEALIQEFYSNVDDYISEKQAVHAIDSLPSAQPEIIRCKDCKHWFDIDDGRQWHKMCADVDGDWYCADAERREDE